MARDIPRTNTPVGRGQATQNPPTTGNHNKAAQSMGLGEIVDMAHLPPDLPQDLDFATLTVPGLGEMPIMDMRRYAETTSADPENQPCVVIAELETTGARRLVGVIIDTFFRC